jgi:alpha-1,6-mannosyltransferase
MVLVGLSTWLMLVFQPDGSIGLYTVAHVALATFAAVVAAVSLRTVDPLRLRTPRPAEGVRTSDLAGAASSPGID